METAVVESTASDVLILGRSVQIQKGKMQGFLSMACKYGVQDIFLALHLLGFKETKGIGLCRVFERDLRRSATFMCRIYLVAYKFRFDFILWRELSASYGSDRSAQYHTPNADYCGVSTTMSFNFRSHAHGDFHSHQPKTNPDSMSLLQQHRLLRMHANGVGY